MARVGVYHHDVFLEHRPPGYHPENPERIAGLGQALLHALAGAGVARSFAPASEDDLALIHERQYIETIRGLSGRSAALDFDTYICPATYRAALFGAGAALDAAQSVARGELSAAIVLARPPAHHATPSRGMGFCVFNHTALCAVAAVERGWAQRVAIVDWDVHHGNGTQEITYRRGDILYISTHQWPFYPGTGGVAETGEGEGEGATINIPLPAGCGDAEYDFVARELIAPALERFRPELLVVSAGFDAHKADMLAGMRMSSAGFRALARRVFRAAGAPAVVVLEGGYDPDALRESLCQVALELCGEPWEPSAFGPPDPQVTWILQEARALLGVE